MGIQIRNIIIPILWLIILLFNINNFFFWDTIQLGAKHASWFYDNNFSSFFLPEEINSGHPPFFGMLLAILWKIFGKHLIIGHILMVLITLGSIYQAHKLGEKWTNRKWAFLFPIVMFCNPYFLGHSILVSPDNLLIFLFLWALNTQESRKNLAFSVATLFIAMTSMRGMMLVLSLLLAEYIYDYIISKKVFIRTSFKYLLSIIFVFLFLGIHFVKNNWIGFHEESPWEESFDMVSVKGYLYNLGLIAWRLVDFGNVFIVLPIIFLCWKLRKTLRKEYLWIITIIISFVIIFVLPLSLFKYLTNHRYFMPVILISSFLFVKLCIDYNWQKWIAIFFILVFLGNFWIYPREISQGWDVSLAHVPFYSLTHEMNERIEEMDINPNSIGTEFPLKSAPIFLYLDDGQNHYREADIFENKYILYSRIMNDFKDEEKEYLNKNFKIIENLQRGKIDLILYERN